MITQEYLKSRLRYEPETGHFYWITASKSNQRFIGKRAESIHNGGYFRIYLLGRHYQAHRLAWLYAYGEMSQILDHINRNKRDNRIENLRVCTKGQNYQNHNRKIRKSGLPIGVTKNHKRYKTEIRFNWKRQYLGTYDTPEEASAVYQAKRKELFGKFAG